MNHSSSNRPLTVLALLTLAGCAAGPDYHAPKTPVPSAFANAGQTNAVAEPDVATWWRSFGDPGLNQMIDQALVGNLDLRIATANLREARALRRQTEADWLPVPRATAGYTRTLSSQSALPGVPRESREIGLYDAGFDATWELDLFGHVRRSVQAARAEAQAVEASRRDVQVTLVSETGRNYFELRGLQNELAVARRNAENQQETVKITQARLEGGRGTQLDVARAQAQLSSTRASIPPLEAGVSHAMHRLAVLTGKAPTELVATLREARPLPTTPGLTAIGTPEALLRRRPDIRMAERELAAVTARVGIATSDLFPRVTFNGRVGLEASTFAGLTKSGGDTWSFGPSITWAALDYGHVRARIQAAGARAEASLAAYERAVLTALEETENSLVDFGREQTRRDHLQEAVTASELAANLARQRYENGATDFLTVLDSERVLLEAQVQLAQSQTRVATALVSVYKSLGGGWEAPAPAPVQP